MCAIESKLQAVVSSQSCSEKWRADRSTGTDRDSCQLFVDPFRPPSPSVIDTGTTEGSNFSGVVGIVDTIWYASASLSARVGLVWLWSVDIGVNLALSVGRSAID